MFKFIPTEPMVWQTACIALIITASLCLVPVEANPMRPDTGKPATTSTKPVQTVTQPSLPALTSTLIIGDYRVAVFTRGRERTEGQRINGYRVIRIEPDYVVVEQGNKKVTLKIKSVGALSITPASKE